MIKFCNHPEFIHNLPTYLAINDFVNGKRPAVSKYLRRYDTEMAHSKEGDRAFANRQARLYNKNLVQPPLVIHLAHLSQEITTRPIIEGSALEPILADMTGFGLKFKNFYRELIWEFIKSGRWGALVDSPSSKAPTKVAAQVAGERSFCRIFKAHQIRHWEYFESGPKLGKLKKIVLQLPPVIDPKDPRKRYDRLYMMESVQTNTPLGPEFSVSWYLLQDRNEGPLLDFVNGAMESVPQAYTDEREFEEIDKGAIELDEIPFVMLGEGPEESIAGDVWELNYATLNLNSTLTNIIYHQGFQRILFAGASQEEVKYLSECIAAITTNEKAQVFPIEAGNPEAAFREISILENRARRTALMEHNQLMSEESKESPSAESKAMDMKARTKYYDYILDLMEDKLEQILAYICAFEGVETVPDVEIARDYGLSDEQQTAAEDGMVFGQAGQLGAMELQKEILRRWVNKQNIPEETKKKIIANIDSAAPNSPGVPSFGSFDQQTTTGQDSAPII